MNQFRVIVQPLTFQPTGRGPVTGQVWMELGGRAFPEAGWNDFPVIVLGWWCEAVSEALETGTEGELRFMDGPFSISIHVEPGENLRLVARERRGTLSMGSEKQTSTAEQVRSQVLAAANVVIEYCGQYDIENQDVQALRAGVQNLRKSVPSRLSK